MEARVKGGDSRSPVCFFGGCQCLDVLLELPLSDDLLAVSRWAVDVSRPRIRNWQGMVVVVVVSGSKD